MNLEKVYHSSPIGVLEIVAIDSAISSILFIDNDSRDEETGVNNKVIKKCIKQLDEYFNGNRTSFDVSLNPEGTEFRKRVWKELLNIPFGKTVSYLDVSVALGDKNATRAVGNANGKNPICIIVPCHRVIGTDGSLTGYGGGMWRKEWLLRHEGVLKPKPQQTSLF